MNNLAIDIGRVFLGPSYGGSHGSVDPWQSLSGIGSLVSLFLKISFVLTGIILMFYFLLGGIGLMSSGNGDPQKAEQAKKTITSAVIGFIVVFTAYWIVKLLEQVLGIGTGGLL